jgi:hypothetical protein
MKFKQLGKSTGLGIRILAGLAFGVLAGSLVWHRGMGILFLIAERLVRCRRDGFFRIRHGGFDPSANGPRSLLSSRPLRGVAGTDAGAA